MVERKYDSHTFFITVPHWGIEEHNVINTMANESLTLGKSTEFLITSKLLDSCREVYLPVVDDHGVDILVLTKSDNHSKVDTEIDAETKRPLTLCYENEYDEELESLIAKASKCPYQELQVKSLTKGGLFAAINCPNPKPNYWYVFYVKSLDKIWLINSVIFVKIASQNKKGKNKNKYSLTLATKSGVIKHKEFLITDFNKLP